MKRDEGKPRPLNAHVICFAPCLPLGLVPPTPEPEYDQGMVPPLAPPATNAALISANEASVRGVSACTAIERTSNPALAQRHSQGDGSPSRSSDSVEWRGVGPPPTLISTSAFSAPAFLPETVAAPAAHARLQQQAAADHRSGSSTAPRRMASLNRLPSTEAPAHMSAAVASFQDVNVDLGGSTMYSDAELGSLIQRISAKPSPAARRTAMGAGSGAPPGGFSVLHRYVEHGAWNEDESMQVGLGAPR